MYTTEDCILWVGFIRPGGYGVLRCSVAKSKWGTRLAHRDALSEKLGRALLPFEFACHHCDTPACVNPYHLYLGDAKTNALDRKLRGRNADQKLKPPNLGRKFSASTKAKHRARMESLYASGWVHPMSGRKHSTISKLRISDSLSRRGANAHNT